MPVIDQLNKGERPLAWLGAGIGAGMFILLAGLWWVQIVSAKTYEESLKNQQFRTVRVPALRGKILDRNGLVLAENAPRYNVNVYFEELLGQFTFQYTNHVKPEFVRRHPGAKMSGKTREELNAEARYRAVSNLTFRVAAALGRERVLDRRRFLNHYVRNPFMPFPIVENLSPQEVAVFSEQLAGWQGVELEGQPVRVYPQGAVAAHLTGCVQRQDVPRSDEDISFKYYLPDYAGLMGVEAAFDATLRGRAGVKSLMVNHRGYRQREEIPTPARPGENIRLTLDMPLQRDVEKALRTAMPETRGAAVVVDVRNGDILAMASAPGFDPNLFVTGLSAAEAARLNDELLRPAFNRATFGAYTPGSIFKIITAIACFEAGVVDPRAIFRSPGYFQETPQSRPVGDTAPAGDYDFIRAFRLSSNTYFIHYGLRAGFARIVETGRRFHLGEKTLLPTRQETGGFFPDLTQGARWTSGRTANLCIGQEIAVTPLQMTMMTAAVANGGKLFWPRLVACSEPADDSFSGTGAVSYASGRVREHLRLSPAHLDWIHRAMLADVETEDGEQGTGRRAFLPGFRIAGKTGTAEIKSRGREDKNTWFVSFGPYENPRYAVTVLVESGVSGGATCAPVARRIYEAIRKREAGASGVAALAAVEGGRG